MSKKVTTFAIFAALMVIGGYVFNIASKLIPIPGSKFIVVGPYMTFMMMLVLIRYPRFGTISLINLVFGGLSIIFSPWMTVAVVLSGIIADCMMLIPIRKRARQLLTMAVYNGVSLLTSFYISNYITGNALYKFFNFKVLAAAFLISALTGALGGYAGLKVNKTYLRTIA